MPLSVKINPWTAAVIYTVIAAFKGLVLKDLTGFMFWFVDLIFFIVIPSVLFFITRKSNLYTPVALSFEKSLKILINFIFMLIAIFITAAIGRLVYDGYLKELNSWTATIDYKKEIPKIGYAYILVVTYACVSAAVVEEWIFRKSLFPETIRTWFSVTCYVLGSSSLFAIAHFSSGPNVTVSAWFVGVGLTLGYMLRRSLLALMLAHCFVDFMYFSKLN